jgi:hypothetical protein
MLNCDEIVIELSREQSVSNSGAGSWTNQIPDLILEEGDQITCEGGWISVSNSGDGSIEILDNQNPDNNNVDASFYVSYYKVMDSKNCVAFPYHSLKQLEGDSDFTGYGFKKPLPESDVATTERYNNIPTYNGQNITEIATYQSLVNEKDADKYGGTTAEEYFNFLINADFKQSIRDLANTGNYYTALYRKDNGQYELLQRKVDVVIPKGYYSPDNLASFITEQIQTKYFNESVDGRPPETWTNCGRYVNAMTQVSVPNLNLGFFNGNVDTNGPDGSYVDFISTNSPPRTWESDGVSGTGGIAQPIYGAFGTGFTGYYKGSNCLIRQVTDTIENKYVPARPITYPSTATYPTWGMMMDIYPQDDNEREDLTYLMNLANNYTGITSQFFEDTGIYPTNVGNQSYETNTYGGFSLSIFMMINTIEGTAGTIARTMVWGGEIAYTLNQNPLLNENKPIAYIEDEGCFRIVFTMNLCNDMILDTAGEDLYNYPPRATTYTEFYNQPPVWTEDIFGNVASFTGGVLLSAGGVVRILDKQPYTPYTYNFRLPIGLPMYCGLPRLVIGEEAENYRQLFVNNSTPYSWFTFQNKQPITTNYNPAIPSTAPTSTPSMNYNVTNDETKSLTDYQNGNKYLGMTCCNFSRWSLRNYEEPDRVQNPETNPDVMPILRKYPLFMKYGMATNQYAYKDGEYKKQSDPIYPAFPSGESTLTFSELDQTGNTIFTNQVYTAVLPNGKTAIENWWNFINAQIQDGLIDVDGGDDTYFYAYTHFCIQQNLSADQPDNSAGSDIAIQNRPRGLLVKIHRTSFLNKSVVSNYNRGFLISDNNLLGCDALSWIYDKINGESFGFMDATFFGTPISGATITQLQNQGYKLGWGYSYKKTGWRNFTSMLCSYAVEESDETTFMFDSSKSRQLTCNPRVYLGCESANLTFDADGSSRFYWSDFFLTNKIANKYNEGVENSGGNYSPSIQQPFYNIYKGFADGVSGVPPDGGGEGIVWSNDKPANSEAGTEIIQYNKGKRDLYNDGLFQLAPEMTKHLPCITGNTTHNSEQGNYVAGNIFPYCYPVDTDYTTRFFCFDQDVRYNTWEVGQYEYPHTTTFVQYGTGGGVFADWGIPTNITSFTWNNWDGDYNNGTTDPATENIQGAKYLTTSRFWGSMSGDTGFIETTSEAGTCRPDRLVIYDSPSGIQVFNWGAYDRDNWDNSFWDIIGFKSTDMMATPFMYCGQQRNYTTNFMTSSSSTFRTHSFPMRTDADLTISGFVGVTTNIQGQTQYVLQYPRQNFISSVGLMGINNLEQNAYTFVGGTAVAEGITTYYPYQFTSYVLMATTGGGATYLNGQLLPEEFAILYTASTKNYASDVADKLQSPFYLIRCNLAEDNFKYTNNAVVPSVMPIMGVISKQYGSTSDWYYSTDSVNMVFTNRRRRVLNEVKISITEKTGKVANTIQAKSTIFFKIRRADVLKEPRFDEDTENLLMMEQELTKEQKKLYQEELDYLLG